MKFFNKLSTDLLILAMFLVIFLAVFLRLAKDWSFPDTTWTLGRGEKIELRDETPVLQKFTAKENNLSRIEVLLGSSKIKGYLEIKLLAEDCNQTIHSSKLKIKETDSNQTYAMNFPALENSENKAFCFSISSKAEKTGSKFPGVFVTDSPAPGSAGILTYPDGKSFQEKSMSIRPGYGKNEFLSNIEELNQRISQYKPFFLKHYYLYSIATLFLILSIGLVVLLILI